MPKETVMHKNKRKEKVPETRESSAVVKELTASVRRDISSIIERLGALALDDAKLSATDGWRFDVERCVYVKVS